MRALRRAWRLPLMILLLLAGLAIELALFPLMGAAARVRTIRAWSRCLLAACGVRLEARVAAPQMAMPGAAVLGAAASGPAAAAAAVPEGGCMLVANHRSWLDIFVIHALAPAQFVAKAEIRGWPLIGLLCERSGTHFIERHRRHAVHDVIGDLSDAMRDGHRVAIFPEGTVNDGRDVLRFHANLLQAAVAVDAPVVPLAIDYRDAAGEDSAAVLYVEGITFARSLWRILAEPVTVARLAVLPPLAPEAGGTRHALARRAERAIRAALGLSPVPAHDGSRERRAEAA